MPPKAKVTASTSAHNSGPKPAGTPSAKSGRKGSGKKQLSTEEQLKKLFGTLCNQVDGLHFGSAVKTCNKILRLAPGDTDALQTKLFMLFQTEQYDEAMKMIESSEESSQYAYEKAYYLYRTHREDESASVLRDIQSSSAEESRGVLHLEAQVKFRQGDYQGALDIYTGLLDTVDSQSEEHSDVLTNLSACQKHLDFIDTDFLRALDQLPSSLTSTLESAPPPTQPHANANVLSSASAPGPDLSAGKPKKVRMSRVPPGVTPGVTPPPDPERWLKKSERTTYAHGGKKRRGGGGATQGSTMEIPSVSGGGGSGKGGGKKKKK